MIPPKNLASHLGSLDRLAAEEADWAAKCRSAEQKWSQFSGAAPVAEQEHAFADTGQTAGHCCS